MKAYAYQAALICEGCGKLMQAKLMPTMADISQFEDSNSFPQGPYENGGGEADCPQHCDHCRIFLENPLTPDGETYVREAVASGEGVNIEEWREFYSYLFE
jgi:hypothetical protein